MKFKKRLLCLTLAVLLITALAIPASAATSIVNRNWSGFVYNTSDTCNANSYYCVIESTSSEYTMRTAVTATYLDADRNECLAYNYGYADYLISSTSGSHSNMVKIKCEYFIGGTWATMGMVYAG